MINILIRRRNYRLPEQNGKYNSRYCRYEINSGANVAKILFRLNGVPDDEAEEVRKLLGAHDIRFYETHAGNWGVSVAAIWLPDHEQFARARELIDQYQITRAERMRTDYRKINISDRRKTWIMDLLARPVQLIVYAAIIAAVVYLSTVPFMNWGS